MTANEDDLQLALELADVADSLTMAVFTGEALAFTSKHDGTPVTETDQLVETTLRRLLLERRPDDGFLGEESGAGGSGVRRWILDPIDGTVSFAAGGISWGTQIALEEHGEIVLGLFSAPAAKARWWGARGAGAWQRRSGRYDKPLAVTRGADAGSIRWNCYPALDELGGRHRALAERLHAIGPYAAPRIHGTFEVAEGFVDVCLQLGGEPWDYAGFAGIVAGAGGRFTYLDGTSDLRPSEPAVFSNGAAHHAALAALR